jgi:sarcosine oxidase
MANFSKCEVIVIGLGAMGSAAVYQLARRGVRVTGIDQYDPPHVFGSTHGDTRITRQAIGEGLEYVPLVLRSNEIWREIEQETRQALLTITGGLIMTSRENAIHHGSNFFEQTVAAARQYKIEHELLDANQITKRFPPFKLSGTEKGYLEKGAGFLRPEACVSSQLALARKYNADIRVNEHVLDILPQRSGAVVRTDRGEYRAEKIILSAGPWITQFLEPPLCDLFKVYRQVLYWFDVQEAITPFEPARFPVWIWEFGPAEDDMMYGFPAVDGGQGGVKMAFEQLAQATTPETVSRNITGPETQHMYARYIEPHMAGLKNKLVKTATCLYTVTPDYRFVIDALPGQPDLIIASPCSGHGFKHSAAIGEVLAELAVAGKSTLDISTFSLARLKV